MNVVNAPHLFINYYKGLEPVRLGPYYTLSPDGGSPGKWSAYTAQDASGNFRRVIVPYYHSISAVISECGMDIC